MVLTDIKKLIGFDEDYKAFDQDITVQINSALSTLYQIGVNVIGTVSTDGDEDWSDILGEHVDIEMIKNYIYLKTKLVFDPPLNGSILEAIKEQIKEYEWRINLEVEVPSDSIWGPETTDEEDYEEY